MTSPKLTGKRVLITGAARGSGRALAARMLADGARLILAAVAEESGRQTAAGLGADAAPSCVWEGGEQGKHARKK